MSTYVCPQCEISLHAVQVRSHYGAPFIVEQCGTCGGVWCDAFEHHRVHDADVQQLDHLDEALLMGTTRIPETLRCPKDQAVMRLFVDPNFPKDLAVETCPTCSGLWFNRGELATYRAYFDKRWPRPPSRSPAGLLTEVYLQQNSMNAAQARERQAVRDVTRELFLSLASFLMAKPAAFLGGQVMAVIPYMSFLAKYIDTSNDAEVRVDMDEFRALLRDVSQTAGHTQ